MTFAAETGWPLGDQVEGGKTQVTGVTGLGQRAFRREEITGVERSETEATGVTGPGQGAPLRGEVTPVELAGREA